MYRVTRGKYEPMDDTTYSEELRAVITQMLSLEPDVRLAKLTRLGTARWWPASLTLLNCCLPQSGPPKRVGCAGTAAVPKQAEGVGLQGRANR